MKGQQKQRKDSLMAEAWHWSHELGGLFGQFLPLTLTSFLSQASLSGSLQLWWKFPLLEDCGRLSHWIPSPEPKSSISPTKKKTKPHKTKIPKNVISPLSKSVPSFSRGVDLSLWNQLQLWLLTSRFCEAPQSSCCLCSAALGYLTYCDTTAWYFPSLRVTDIPVVVTSERRFSAAVLVHQPGTIGTVVLMPWKLLQRHLAIYAWPPGDF